MALQSLFAAGPCTVSVYEDGAQLYTGPLAAGDPSVDITTTEGATVTLDVLSDGTVGLTTLNAQPSGTTFDVRVSPRYDISTASVLQLTVSGSANLDPSATFAAGTAAGNYTSAGSPPASGDVIDLTALTPRTWAGMSVMQP